MGWVGGLGQSIDDMIEDINNFTAVHKELVILYLSHDVVLLDPGLLDAGWAGSPLSQQDWQDLFDKLKGINRRFAYPNGETKKLRDMTLNDFIGNNEAAVIVLVQPTASGITPDEEDGFYRNDAHFPNTYNSYSNTNDPGTMESATGSNGQIYKMKANGADNYFVLSWTLTLSTTQILLCSGPLSEIVALASSVKPDLYMNLLNDITDQNYPNVLYIDNVDTTNIAALAMAVNNRVLNREAANPGKGLKAVN